MAETVQVAIVGLFSTVIATMGVLGVAFLNNRRKAPETNPPALAENTHRERIFALMDEIVRKERAILAKERENTLLQREIRDLRAELAAERGKTDEAQQPGV